MAGGSRRPHNAELILYASPNYESDKIKDEMGRECRMGARNTNQILVGKP
jgi:hypothetical protein